MNEFIFIAFSLFLCLANIIAFRLGKTYLIALIVTYSLLMNIFVLKQFTLFGFMTAGGNALYGAIFLATDILSEHYGKKEAFKSVILGFFTMIIFVIASQILLVFTPNEYDFAHEHLSTLFTLMPRILIGSLLAYLLAQSLDVVLYHRLKKFTKNKFLFLRNNVSTLVSQLIDTIIFTAVGLTTFSCLNLEGVISPDQFWEIVLVAYVLKVIFAAIDTPFLYLSYKFLPKKNSQK